MGSLNYIPPSIYVLDPLQITAMGIKVRRSMNGEKKWEEIVKARLAHPDGRKTVCFINGALIYSHPFPERLAPEMLPPEAWLHEAGITETSLAEAVELLDLKDPRFMKKRLLCRQINEAMDG